MINIHINQFYDLVPSLKKIKLPISQTVLRLPLNMTTRTTITTKTHNNNADDNNNNDNNNEATRTENERKMYI